MNSHLRHVLLGPAVIKRDSITWLNPLVTAIITALSVYACVATGNSSAVFPLAIGVSFVGITNFGVIPIERIKSMAWGILWLSIATFIGASISNFGVAQIPFVIMAALVAGFAGALGARGSLIGVISLVILLAFAGAPETERTALASTAQLALGGLLQLVIGGAVLLISDHRRTRSHGETDSHTSIVKRLRDHASRTDMFTHHAVRLAIAIGVATALAQSLGWPHKYWIPMIVVWMTRPDRNGTTTRVIERTIGTLIGLGVSLFFLDVLQVGQATLPIFVFIGTLIALAFFNANYPIAVTGITLLVMTLFVIDGDPITDTAPYRLVSTLIAAVITVLASFIWPYKPRTNNPNPS
jgi:MFS family permease